MVGEPTGWNITDDELDNARCVLDTLMGSEPGLVTILLGVVGAGPPARFDIFVHGDGSAVANLDAQAHDGGCPPGYMKSDRLRLRDFDPSCAQLTDAQHALECLGVVDPSSTDSTLTPDYAAAHLQFYDGVDDAGPVCPGA